MSTQFSRHADRMQIPPGAGAKLARMVESVFLAPRAAPAPSASSSVISTPAAKARPVCEVTFDLDGVEVTLFLRYKIEPTHRPDGEPDGGREAVVESLFVPESEREFVCRALCNQIPLDHPDIAAALEKLSARD